MAVAVPENTRSFRVYLRTYRKHPIPTKNIEGAVKLLRAGKVQAVFYTSISLMHYLSQLGPQSYRLVAANTGRYYHYIVFSKELSREVVSAVSGALKKLLISGKISVVISSLNLDKVVAPANRLILANIEWPPYEYMENGRWSGIDVDVIKRVFGLIGFEVRIIKLNWLRVLSYVKSGMVDGTFTISKTPERERYMWYSKEPLTTGNYGFYYLKSKGIGKKLGKKRLRCAYVKGYSYESLLLKNLDLNFVPVPNDYVGIKALVDGRVDLFIANEFVGEYYLKKLGVFSKAVYVPLEDHRLYYVALSKVDGFHLKILDLFSEKLREFKKTNEYRRILHNYGLTYQRLWRMFDER